MHRYSLPVSVTSKDRLSPIHNLMNYSIPHNDAVKTKLNESRRSIQHGDVNTRIRQLESEVEQLTLSNVRLLRSNRILKLDCDRVVDELTAEQRETNQKLTQQNVLLQRSNRLLRDDLFSKTEELRIMRNDQVRNMKAAGPEYEYLVQVINLLYRQISGNPTCDKKCCYTNKPIDTGSFVIPSSPDLDSSAKHYCRPIIHSTTPSGNLICSLQEENEVLQKKIEDMDVEQENMLQQLKEVNEDKEKIKQELRIKEEIVSQLERDFQRMEEDIAELQKDGEPLGQSPFSDIHVFPTPPSTTSSSYYQSASNV